MEMIKLIIPYIVFLFVLTFLYWRPKDLNEAFPATIGALIILATGGVTFQNIIEINDKIGSPSLTILSSIVISIVLESFGLFSWAAHLIATYIKGSGKKLFIFVNLFCILVTFLFNNDGSILITTPIIIFLLKGLKLKPHEQLPFLISGGIVATASSLPIGVSNIVNLISLKVLGIDLYMHAIMIFVPGVLGTLFLILMLYLAQYKFIPKTIPLYLEYPSTPPPPKHEHHPIKRKIPVPVKETIFSKEKVSIYKKILVFVIATRISLYVASYLHIPFEYISLGTAIALLLYRWKHLKMGVTDLLYKTPWHVILFAYTMYIIIFGMKNSGLTNLVLSVVQPLSQHISLQNTVIMTIFSTFLANIFNNHPALMINTLSLTQLPLSMLQLKLLYTSALIGSDLGALLLPIGTLATLLWVNILRKNKVKITWEQYLSVSLKVIPISIIFTVIVLYGWMLLIRTLFHLW